MVEKMEEKRLKRNNVEEKQEKNEVCIIVTSYFQNGRIC
jgi:hypothetical protein